jgi:hypothetical protein
MTLKRSKNVSILSYPSMQCSDRGFTSDFQTHFKEIAKQHSPVQRGYYVHLTTVVVCIRYDVMGISRLSTNSHRTHAARRLRCEQSKTVSCVLAFSERTSFDAAMISCIICTIIFHTILQQIILTSHFVCFLIGGRDAVLYLHVY